LIELIDLLSWRWGLPITLYPGAPPQYRSGVSQLPTSQPLKQGYIATTTNCITIQLASLDPTCLIGLYAGVLRPLPLVALKIQALALLKVIQVGPFEWGTDIRRNP
jgi:hypothetical protein